MTTIHATFPRKKKISKPLAAANVCGRLKTKWKTPVSAKIFGSLRFSAKNLRLSNRWIFLSVNRKKKAHKLKKILGTPAGCPWDTQRDKQGSTGQCPRDFLLFALEKLREKGIIAGTLAGCPRDSRLSRRFSEILCDLSLCAFSAVSSQSIESMQKSRASCKGATREVKWFRDFGPFCGRDFRDFEHFLQQFRDF